MGYTIFQAGTTLVPMNTAGQLGPALTLPVYIEQGPTLITEPAIVLSRLHIPRFARFLRYLILVNTPTKPLTIDEFGTVRLLTLPTPSTPAPVLSGASGGTLSGTYLVKMTYIIKDANGNVIAESDYSSPSNEFTVTNQFLRVTGIPLSPIGITAIRLYRTTTGPGGVYFKWVDLPGNTQTSYQDDLPDAALSIVAGPILGIAPNLTLIAEWQARLWGVDRRDVDHLRYSESGVMYAWSAENTIPIPHVGDDAAGITGIVPRRNALGVGRRTSFAQITGTSNSNFQCVTVSGGEQASFISQESCVVRNDVAIFLGLDGVYRWDSSGITSITDGKVRSWFATDDYFNRNLFHRAFAQLDRAGLKYRLFLTSVGSLTPDRWVEFDLLTGAWFGPHKTDAFQLSCAVDVITSNGQIAAMIGGREGFVSCAQAARNDWTTVPIASIIRTKEHSLGEPDLEKFFGELSINGKVQAAGTVNVVPYIDGVDTTNAGANPISYTMTNGRQRLPRMGVGKLLSLGLTHSTLNQEVMLYGYEVNPVNIVGRR